MQKAPLYLNSIAGLFLCLWFANSQTAKQPDVFFVSWFCQCAFLVLKLPIVTCFLSVIVWLCLNLQRQRDKNMNTHTPAIKAGANLRRFKTDFTFMSFIDIYDLRGVDFTGCDLRGADFTGCNLRGAKFNGATLNGAIFYSADVTGVSFEHASLRGAVFRLAICTHAKFFAADTAGIDLSEANINETFLINK